MKKIGYILSSILILGLLFNCKSGNLKNNPSFKVISSTYYNWTGGQPGVKGTNVVIKLLKVDLINFKADSIYFNNKGTKAEMHPKNDTLVLMGYFSTPRVPIYLEIEPSQNNSSKISPTKIPYTLKTNEAILTYFNDGIKKVLRLSDVVKTNNKYYP
ncbi:MAG: hypothetical protein HQ471_03215 [Flavobacteriales bacterium]|jgi:hypothetical protein|nr:hypothetical protein [Flavobacteriales bacterium]